MRDFIIAIVNFIHALFDVEFREDQADIKADRGFRIKRAKIRRVFKREGGLISGSLSSGAESLRVCEHPGRCALGALLAASGIPDLQLNPFGMPKPEWYVILFDDYGLENREARDLLDVNDGGYSSLWKLCGIGGTVTTAQRDGARVCVVNAGLDRIINRNLPAYD